MWPWICSLKVIVALRQFLLAFHETSKPLVLNGLTSSRSLRLTAQLHAILTTLVEVYPISKNSHMFQIVSNVPQK